MATKICKTCGNEFEGIGRKAYCSTECREEGTRKVKAAAQQRWKEKNPDYFSEWTAKKLADDPDYFARKMREYDRVNPSLHAGSLGQTVSKVESWEDCDSNPENWTDEQKRAYEDIKRIKRELGL